MKTKLKTAYQQADEIAYSRFTGKKAIFLHAKPLIYRIIKLVFDATRLGPYKASLTNYIDALHIIADDNNEQLFEKAVHAVCMIAKKQGKLRYWKSKLQNAINDLCFNHGFKKIKLLSFKVNKIPDHLRTPPTEKCLPITNEMNELIICDLTELSAFAEKHKTQQNKRRVEIAKNLKNQKID